MKSKSILILLIYFLLGIVSCNSHVNTNASSGKKTVYNFYRQPVSCVDNLECLFEIWPVDQINNAKDIELVSYTSHGLIKDSLQINFYAKLMSQWDTPYLSKVGYQSGGQQGNHSESYITINTYHRMLEKVPQGEVALAKESIERELLNIRKLLLQTLKVGYRVFSIKFKYLGEEMNTCIFCDPDSHEVIFDVIFLNVPL